MFVCAWVKTNGWYTSRVSHDIPQHRPEMHSDLDVVDGMNVFHGVLDDLAHLLQTLERPQGGHGVPLYHDVALRQEFDRLHVCERVHVCECACM